MKYNNLTFIKEAVRKNGKKYSVFKCDCGIVKEKLHYDVVRGMNRSCGISCHLKKKRLEGKRFGLMTVIKEVKPIHHNKRRWLLQCDCGKECEVDQLHLTRTKSSTRSCGCIGKQKKFSTKSLVHYRRLYNIWHKMKCRCFIQNNSDFHKYGARGIKVSKRWLDFSTFYDDMIDTYHPGLTIERIDVNGNYCKQNCTWIPRADQAKNRRTTRWVNGMCAKDACKIINLNYHTFLYRLKSGETIKQAYH